MQKENKNAVVKNRVILNLFQDLQRSLLLFINNLRGRFRIKYTRTTLLITTRGFTLIELLVVVLIIGILAAVAVPQYQRGVLKSRFNSLMTLGKALNEGNEVYYLGRGTYANKLSDLDVTTDPVADIVLGNEYDHQYVQLSRGDIHNRLTMYQTHSTNFPGEIHCEAEIDHKQANWLCKEGLQGTFIGNKYSYAVYALGTNTPHGTLDRTYLNTQNLSIADGDLCLGDGSESKGCYKVKANNATCEGHGDACQHGEFRNNSTCKSLEGTQRNCSYSEYFSGSICIGNRGDDCRINTYDNAFCVGNAWYSCSTNATPTKFNNHSICVANGTSSCKGGYDATSCCVGRNCPNEADTCAAKGIAVPDKIAAYVLPANN